MGDDDGRSDDASANGVVAGGRSRVVASLFASTGRGHEARTRGDVETENARRTALNPRSMFAP